MTPPTPEGLGGLLAVIYGAAIAGSEWTWGTLKNAVARGEGRVRYMVLTFASIAVLVGIGMLVAFIVGVVAAVVGASWSLFLRFRGGRGVGTGVGTMLVIQPLAVLLATPVFVAVIVITRYVSLGSLVGSAAVAAWTWLFWMAANGSISVAYPIYTALGAGLVWLAHADNIERLRAGTERKFDLGLLSGRRPGPG